MPFDPDTLPAEEPAVRIYFTGLMIFEPIDGGACQVLVNSSATRHYLTIEVRRKRTNQPDEIMMRHVGPLAFIGPEDDPQNPPIHGMRIEKFPQGANSVRRYTGNAVGSNGEESFDLAIDMAAPTFHNGNPPTLPDLVTGAARNLLDIDNLVGRPSIFLDDGILHTAAKTSGKLTITLKQRGQNDKPLAPFAKVIGANIYLNNGERLGLRWRNQGKEATLFLDKPTESGLSYEIYVVNDPLFESSGITNPVLDPKHDEFAEYYKLLTAVPTDQQFRLQVVTPLAGPPDKGSTDIPCMPVIKGGG